MPQPAARKSRAKVDYLWLRIDTQCENRLSAIAGKLRRMCRTLTLKETKVGAMIVEGFMSHQIEAHLKSKEHSIENNRFNLRRKLGVEKGKSLREFLCELIR